MGHTGYSVNLVKESTVHSDHHELLLEVSDQQGKSAFHNLSVTVCSCLDSETPNCHVRTSGTTLGAGGVGMIFLAMLLITGWTHVSNISIIINKISSFIFVVVVI